MAARSTAGRTSARDSSSSQPDGSIVGEGGAGSALLQRPLVPRLRARPRLPEPSRRARRRASSCACPTAPKSTDDALKSGYEVAHRQPRRPTRSARRARSPTSPRRRAWREGAPASGITTASRSPGQRYSVFLNGELVNDFIGERGARRATSGSRTTTPIRACTSATCASRRSAWRTRRRASASCSP